MIAILSNEAMYHGGERFAGKVSGRKKREIFAKYKMRNYIEYYVSAFILCTRLACRFA